MGQDESTRNDFPCGRLHGEGFEQGATPSIHLDALERLIVFRRRKGLSVSKEELLKIAEVPPHPEDITESERCYILRRRLGKTQRQCAAELGISRYWFNQMEQGKAPCDTLVRYWSNHAG